MKNTNQKWEWWEKENLPLVLKSPWHCQQIYQLPKHNNSKIVFLIQLSMLLQVQRQGQCSGQVGWSTQWPWQQGRKSNMATWGQGPIPKYASKGEQVGVNNRNKDEIEGDQLQRWRGAATMTIKIAIRNDVERMTTTITIMSGDV